ncbi:hypothetical protein MNBD_GAMMA11-104 [hydrothermal vent metagenome]|uniref:DUF3619 family protein n=1 Tax=hydrothermal vent metagenome TaxID=652676 RepID=A0A3B0X616_9ZZZZ
MNSNDDEFLKQTRKTLDESADSLDAATLSRLNQARQKALQSQTKPGILSSTLPAGIMAGLGVAVVTAWLLLSQTQSEQAQQHQLAYETQDMDMLTSDTELELLEDLEFVSWLVLEQNNAG